MYKKSLFSVIVFLLLSFNVHAYDEDLLFYDLSFAGYRIGMTYEQAASVRPFDYLEDRGNPNIRYRYYVAVIDGLYLADEEMALEVYFQNDRLQKVLARFRPSSMDNMFEFFKKTIGPCENNSRKIKHPSGEDVQQYIYKWSFPSAKMLLVGYSSNNEFATASLVAKDGVIEIERDKLNK